MIIEINALSNGAHKNQSGDIKTIPNGWIKVPAELEKTAQSLLPFVALTIENGVITDITDNADARAAQEAQDAEREIPLDELTLTQLAIAELAEAQEATQTASELALAELAEIITGGE